VARKKTAEPFQFESALAELEELVELMEKGELGLDESLQHFERGVALTRACQKALKQAGQKIRKLTDDGKLVDLDPLAEDED
jgi:exodeoxyribonuclease VII small subunit